MSENTQEKQRLLIVDDSKVIRVTARKILRDHFDTIEAVDGEDAWDKLSADESFVLVVSDLTMPRLDGFGLLERIRGSHLPQVREIPVIIITGANDSEATMERARQAGATDFIGKPFDAVHLLARTQAHADSHAARNALMQEKAELEEQSGLDPLTGLFSESAFMDRGYQQLAYAIRHGGSLGMFRIEIDDYNEHFREHGESFTNSLIQTMGWTLASVLRQEDVAARVGAARFSVLLPGLDEGGIHSLAERINRNFAGRQFRSAETTVAVTISVGVAAPAISRDYRFEQLLEMADSRLGEAIRLGGNRVVYREAGAAAGDGMAGMEFPGEDDTAAVGGDASAGAADSAVVAAEVELATDVEVAPAGGGDAFPAFDTLVGEAEEIELAADAGLAPAAAGTDAPGAALPGTGTGDRAAGGGDAFPAFDDIMGELEEIELATEDLYQPAAPSGEAGEVRAVTTPGAANEGPVDADVKTDPAEEPLLATPQVFDSPVFAEPADRAAARVEPLAAGETDILLAAPFSAHGSPASGVAAANDEPAPDSPAERKGFFRRLTGLFRRRRSSD